MIAIPETPGLLITFGTISVVDFSKRRTIEPSVTAFIGFPFALVFTCTFTNITKYMSFGILFEICSRGSCLNSHAKVLSKAPHLAGLLRRLDFLLHNYCEQNKTLRSESTNGVSILISLLLDQKLHLLLQAHHNFEINLTSFVLQSL